MLQILTGLTGTAFAQAAAQAPARPPGILGLLARPEFMLLIIFAIIYLLIMRPQQKKQREHLRLLRNLKKGDRVVTASGLYGTIANLDEKIVLLQVDQKVRIKVSRSSVSALTDDDIGT